MKGNYVKCIATTVLGVVLAVTVVALPSGDDGNYAGPGNGTNAKVSSLGEFSSLIEEFERSPMANFSARTLASPNGEESADASHKSATMHETTVSVTSMDAGSSGSSFSRITREMTVYLTDDAAFYSSDFQMKSTSSSPKKEEKDGVTETKTVEHDRYLSMHMMLYVDAERVLLRFDRLLAIADGVTFSGEGKLCGRWAEFSATDENEYRAVYSAMTSLNLFNYKVLSQFGQMISEHEEDFDRNGDHYILNKDAAEKLFGDVSGIPSGSKASSDGSFEVDLTDAAEPQIKLGLSASMSGRSANDVYVSASASEEDIFTFCNIDNTRISMPSSLNTMPLSDFVDAMDEFAKVMEGKDD